MKRIFVTLLVALFAAVAIVPQAAMAREKKEKKKAEPKEMRWSGTIQRSNKDASTLTVRKGNIEKTVVYDSSTMWTKGKDKGTLADFKDGSRVICLGKYDEKGRLMATRIDLRPPR